MRKVRVGSVSDGNVTVANASGSDGVVWRYARRHAVRHPRRSVLLFVGPTGVGKAELARALAELLFGDPGRKRLRSITRSA